MGAWIPVALGGMLLAGFVMMWLKQGKDQHTGALIEAGAVSQDAALAEVRIAQAAVNAPRSQAALVASMKDGSF